MPTMRSCLLLAAAAAGILPAGEAPPPAPPDPALAIVAEGASIYRQRDLDALMQIALRHARTREFAADGRVPALGRAEEDQLRQALIRACTAREGLLAALAGLPAAIPPRARDALILDLLAYQAEAAPGPTAVPPEAPPVPSAAAPVILRLPPFTATRAVEGLGRRQLTLGIALAFPDQATARGLEAQAPRVQDAILGALRDQGPAVFADPDHAVLKQALTAAVRQAVPGFPADGLLIPQLESGPADAPAER